MPAETVAFYSESSTTTSSTSHDLLEFPFAPLFIEPPRREIDQSLFIVTGVSVYHYFTRVAFSRGASITQNSPNLVQTSLIALHCLFRLVSSLEDSQIFSRTLADEITWSFD